MMASEIRRTSRAVPAASLAAIRSFNVFIRRESRIGVKFFENRQIIQRRFDSSSVALARRPKSQRLS